MCSVRYTLTTYSRKAVERRLKTAQQQGHVRQVQYLLAILAVGDGRSFAEVAEVLRVHEKTVAAWVGGFCCDGIHGAPRQKPTGRPPTRTPTPQPALATLIDEGPLKAGFRGGLLALAPDPAADVRPLWRLLPRLLQCPVAQESGL
jgi:hypothetical protein